MADYGREPRFGYFLVPNADEPMLPLAEELERLGYDYIGIQDHPYQRRYLDTWTLLSVIAGRTSRIGLFTDVASLPLRPPAVLAKSAASLDALSDGRFDLGLGAGAFWDAIEAYGGPRRRPGQALAALDEAVTVIRKVTSGERNLRFDGDFYRLAGAHSGPVPTRRIGIWIGAYGPRALALTGRVADGWVPSLRTDPNDPEEDAAAGLVEMNARVDEAAVIAGRSPDEIRRVLNIRGEITDGPSSGLLHGPVEQWVDELVDLAVSIGFDTFVLWTDGGEPVRRRFIEEVAPAVRAQLARERSTPEL